MAQINDSVRQNLVNSTYLHSNKFNFYNAALGGPNYNTIANRGVENTKAFKNMKKIENKLISVCEVLEENEKTFYLLAHCIDNEDFSDKYLRVNAKSVHKKVLKNIEGQDIEIIAKAIAGEISKRMLRNRKFNDYVMGIELSKIQPIVINSLTEQNYWNNFSDGDKEDIINSIIKYHLKKETLKEIEGKIGTQNFASFINKTVAFQKFEDGKKISAERRGGRSGSKQKRIYADTTLEKISKDITNNIAEYIRKNSKHQRNIYMNEIGKLISQIFYQYKIQDKDGRIRQRVNQIMLDYGNEMFKYSGKNSDKFLHAQIETDINSAIGFNGEYTVGISINTTPEFKDGTKMRVIPTGEYSTKKTLYNLSNRYKEDITGNIGDKGFEKIFDIEQTNNKVKIAQDQMIVFTNPDGTEKARYGVQVKNTQAFGGSTIHLRSELTLSKILGTMLHEGLIDNEIRNEILYMLANFYYFNSQEHDSETRITKQNSNNSKYTSDNAATIRYIMVLLQMGIEFVLEPQLETEISNMSKTYTGRRMNEINSQTVSNEKIVGNSFYIYHNTLIPVSYFFKSILNLIQEYEELIKEKKYQTTYFTMSPFTLSGFGEVPDPSETKEKKHNILADYFGEDNVLISKKNNIIADIWTYPEPLVDYGSKNGLSFINNAELGGYQIFMQLDKLQKFFQGKINSIK